MNPSALCAITGATGYVGGRIQRHLEQAGWETVSWSRRPGPGRRHTEFKLGEPVDPRGLEGVGALVHCAYDFTPRRWPEIVEVNVRGTARLLAAARAAGVRRLVVLSSASAFDGCRSLYGQAKLEIESLALEAGALVIRPGLVYGPQPGGVFGALLKQVQESRIIPLLGNGRQLQRLVHEQDLARLIERHVCGEFAAPAAPVFLAHEQPWEMKALLQHIAAHLQRPIRFVHVPWRLVWLALRSLEGVGLRPPFRSDSLLGLVYSNPNPSSHEAQALQASCRPFVITPDLQAAWKS
jgi:nucleoside-diphosphate-sugar epimerase